MALHQTGEKKMLFQMGCLTTIKLMNICKSISFSKLILLNKVKQIIRMSEKYGCGYCILLQKKTAYEGNTSDAFENVIMTSFSCFRISKH